MAYMWASAIETLTIIQIEVQKIYLEYTSTHTAGHKIYGRSKLAPPCLRGAAFRVEGLASDGNWPKVDSHIALSVWSARRNYRSAEAVEKDKS